jgi:hypothetical protein
MGKYAVKHYDEAFTEWNFRFLCSEFSDSCVLNCDAALSRE